jgi:phosphoribosylformylglycinamidine cyclo-ligase
MKAESYLSRGVSPTKDDVKKAIASLSPGLYPGSFCKIIPDMAGDPSWCMAVHADGAGTKSAAAYLMYRETGDPAWYAGIAQDSLVMNTDDLLCIGAVTGFKVSNTIGRNAHRVDGACVKEIISGYDQMASRLLPFGIDLELTGGETADVGDLVRTAICDCTVVVRLPRSQVIDASKIRAGQVIIGLASFGQTTYEDKENSGIGSNGLTAARHMLLHKDYLARYPETSSDTLAPEKAYCGTWHLLDKLPGTELTIGEAILSPTRTYLPVMKAIFTSLGAADPQASAVSGTISGVIHCTGGGQVKCRDFGQGIRYVKDNLFAMPPVFQAIRDSGETREAELYQIFNMGHRLEIYCDESLAGPIIELCSQFNLAARQVGYTEAVPPGQDNEVVIKAGGREFSYK